MTRQDYLEKQCFRVRYFKRRRIYSQVNTFAHLGHLVNLVAVGITRKIHACKAYLVKT